MIANSNKNANKNKETSFKIGWLSCFSKKNKDLESFTLMQML